MSLTDALSSIQEYQQWGYNALTFGFLCTIVLTLMLQLPGELAQVKTLWFATSAEGVDALLIIVLLGYFAIFFVFGVSVGSGGALFNAAVLGPWFALILWRLWRIRGLTITEWTVLGLWTLAAALNVILPWKEFFYMGATIVALWGPLKQISTMKEKGTSTGFNSTFPLLWSIVSMFWVFYGYALGNWFIMGAALIFGVLYAYMYRLAVRLDPCRVK